MFERVLENFRPRLRSRTLDWARTNVQDAYGRPYDHAAYPHTGAPGGPFDSFDCAQYRQIIMQYGSQIAKTFSGICCMMKTADTDPCPMIFGSSDRKLATEEIRVKFYPMLEKCRPLRHQVRPKARQKQDLVELDNCRVFVSWSRSVSTLASKSIRVGMGNEIDKWEHKGAASKTATEADPLELFLDRFKSFPTHKVILESTPTVKGASRIERLRLSSTNCSYYVPCPHCHRYQTLKMGQLKWDKNEAGKSDPTLASKTARYECEHCQGIIKDEHRGTMMRGGVWVPEGCGCDDEKAREAARRCREPDAPHFRGWAHADWITGSPVRDGREAGYQLSSLYALSLSWGDVAAKFVSTKSNPNNFRNFINQWLGETWEIVERKTTWQKLGEKLIDNSLKRFDVPDWASLITIGFDEQDGGDRIPWGVVAWGPARKHAVIAYGEFETRLNPDGSRTHARDLIEQKLLGVSYDGLSPAATLGDSGNRPKGNYEWCLRMNQRPEYGIVLPCKGSSTKMDSEYAVTTLGEDTAMPGMKYVRVDTIRTQVWLDDVLHVLRPDDPGGARLHAGSLEIHQDFLEQVLNDAAILDLNTDNNARESWKRIEIAIPNDCRDWYRYAYAAMLLATRGAPIQPRIRNEPQPKPASAVLSMGPTRTARW